MKTKELVTIEFRYNNKSESTDFAGLENKTITIGVFDTLEEAMNEGNKVLEVFEKHFKLNTAWNRKERFSHNGGCFGHPKRLVSQLGYLQTPFDFYAQITKLIYGDVEQTIVEVLEANARFKEFEKSQKD